MQLPSLIHWKEFPRILSRKEKLVFVLLAAIFLISSFTLWRMFLDRFTEVVPASGGTIVEGVVGFPRFINPLYADTRDADRDLTELVFSGLFTYDSTGRFIPDLAQNYQVLEDGKTVEIQLKEDAFWHDGKPFRADDVMFTVRTLQNPSVKSPVRANWAGVQVEKISDLRVRFTLREPYAAFMEKLTLKIIPAHIWQEVPVEQIALSPLNLKPIGTGPYRVEKTIQDRSGLVEEIRLKAFSKYINKQPFISSLTFKFFENEEKMLSAARSGQIESFPVSSPNAAKYAGLGERVEQFSLPRAFSIFFNLASPEQTFQARGVRQALALAIDREKLAQTLAPDAKAAFSPLLPEFFGFDSPALAAPDKTGALALLKQAGFRELDGKLTKPEKERGTFRSDLKRGSQNQEVKLLQQCLADQPGIYPLGTVNGVFGPSTQQAVIRFQETYAQEILAPSGLTKGNGQVKAGTRAKLNEICFPQTGDDSFSITLTTVAQPTLQKVAEFVQGEWQQLGIQVYINAVSPEDMAMNIIKPRNYEALLFGEALGIVPDPLPFWHSSQVVDPGLNIAGYENKQADALLEKIRKETDTTKRNAFMKQLQDILLADMPAVALYDLSYSYVVPDRLKGIEGYKIADPSQRFANVGEWYIKTGRKWKFF
ncbi:MAG: peptidoglycan-binding protein [Parcubacteria group bacterium]|nr:peptidoglycan-binding protein [Parcubacteria group bacterium]